MDTKPWIDIHRIKPPFPRLASCQPWKRLAMIICIAANATLEREFEDGSGQDQVQAMRRWVVAETDVEAVDQTVDRVPAGADHEE